MKAYKQIVVLSTFYNLENNDWERFITLSKVTPLLSGRGGMEPKLLDLIHVFPHHKASFWILAEWSSVHDKYLP